MNTGTADGGGLGFLLKLLLTAESLGDGVIFGDSITTYQYDPDGHRVEMDDGVDVTQFIYDGNNVLQETDDVGVVEAEFTYIPQEYAHVVSQDRDGTSSFYHFDGINNTSALTDDAEVVTDEYAVDAWGKLRSSTGSTANSQIYKGEFPIMFGTLFAH